MSFPPAGEDPRSATGPVGPHGWPGGGAPPPVCPRHPNVVSYVRCQRCGRPACPQCQRPAPVGIHCVDCVAQAGRQARSARTVAGARMQQGSVVTWTLLGLCVAAFLAQSVVPGFFRSTAFLPVLGAVQPWRFLTTAFLHGSLMHLAFNMYALYLVGPTLESVLGRWRYLAMYLLSALGGSVAVLLFASPVSQVWVTATVGASGAVFGLFGALAFTLRRLNRHNGQILVLIAINLALGFVVPNVSWQAHLGGLATGSLLAFAYLYAPANRRGPIAVLATVGAGVLLVALAAGKYVML